MTFPCPIESNGSVWPKVLYSFGMVCVSVSMMVTITSLAFLLGNVHTSLQGLSLPLQEQLVFEANMQERQKIKNIIKDIELSGPLNAKGLFDITGSTLTGMVSVGITYIIILVQFKMSGS